MAVSTAALGALRRDVCVQASGILIQMAALVFEYRQNMFATVDQEVEKRSSGIEGIDQDQMVAAGLLIAGRLSRR